MPATARPAQLRNGAHTPVRLLAGALPAILVSSLLAGTASWLARVATARGWSEALAWWLQAWGSFAVWATVVTVPAIVLVGWPLDHLTGRLRPLRAAALFGAAGMLFGAAAGYAILAGVDGGWVGAALVAPLGAGAAFVGRLLADPLARSRRLLAALTAVTLALVAYGVATP